MSDDDSDDLEFAAGDFLDLMDECDESTIKAVPAVVVPVVRQCQRHVEGSVQRQPPCAPSGDEPPLHSDEPVAEQRAAGGGTDTTSHYYPAHCRRYSVALLEAEDESEHAALLDHLKAHGWALLEDTDDGFAAFSEAEEACEAFFQLAMADKKLHQCKGGRQGKLALWR